MTTWIELIFSLIETQEWTVVMRGTYTGEDSAFNTNLSDQTDVVEEHLTSEQAPRETELSTNRW